MTFFASLLSFFELAPKIAFSNEVYLAIFGLFLAFFVFFAENRGKIGNWSFSSKKLLRGRFRPPRGGFYPPWEAIFLGAPRKKAYVLP